jgi:hypothetical protein
VSISGPNLAGVQGAEIDGAYLQDVMVIGGNWLIGVTSPHSGPGTFDVVLHQGNNATVIAAAFTYVGPPAPVLSSPPTTTPSTPALPVTSPRPPVTQPRLPVAPPSPPVSQPSPPVTDPPPPATDSPATGPSDPVTTAPVTVVVPGLTLAPLPSNSPLADLPPGLWGGMTCRAASCDG